MINAGSADSTDVGMSTPPSPGSIEDSDAAGYSSAAESSSPRTRRSGSDQLRFVQLNLRHCKAATATMCKYLVGLDKVVAIYGAGTVDQQRPDSWFWY